MDTSEIVVRGLPRDECLRRTYTYLRLTIVVFLLALGTAVVIQTWQQGWHPLASVSAYYYTSARGLLVSSLVGFGAGMIALRGTQTVEDVTLNLAGMFAVLVGIVPTSRGADYRAAVKSCTDVAVALSTKPLDCPTVRSLEKAAQADVRTSVGAFLVVAALALVAALVSRRHEVRKTGARSPFGVGFALVASLWAAVAGTFLLARGWFVENAHYLSAIALAVCVLVIALANAFRRAHPPVRPPRCPASPSGLALAFGSGPWPTGRGAGGTATVLRTDAVPATATVAGRRGPVPLRDRYTWVAVVLLLVLVVGGVLWATGVWSLFWLEIAVAGVFAAFWVVQTIEDPVTQDNHPASER